jgi:hypothetical protein
MRHTLAAIRSGTDPIAALPAATFHRTLEDPIYCPKCDATYMIVADYDWVTSRHFDEESRRPLSMLRKAIFLEHGSAHRTNHFETNGVVITRHIKPAPDDAKTRVTIEQKPLTNLIN